MENKILVDTNVIIGLQRGQDSLLKIFSDNEDDLVISRITACEFIFGSRDKKEKTTNKEFLSQISVIELNEKSSQIAYRLVDDYGLKIKFNVADALIAATAIANNLLLWTENTKHFKIITDLNLFKP